MKSIRIECNFNGTILTKKKVIIEKTSYVIGDIICEDLILSGRIKGNVFCTGRIEMNKDSVIVGKVYTSTFTNLSETDSDFVIQIPRKSVLMKIREFLNNVNTELGLSKDDILTTIRESFYTNVFARKTNPDELIKYEFTEQRKVLKRKLSHPKKSDEKSIQENYNSNNWEIIEKTSSAILFPLWSNSGLISETSNAIIFWEE